MGDKSNSIDFPSNVVEMFKYLKVYKDLDIGVLKIRGHKKHSLIHLVSKYLLSTSQGQDTVPGAGDVCDTTGKSKVSTHLVGQRTKERTNNQEKSVKEISCNREELGGEGYFRFGGQEKPP